MKTGHEKNVSNFETVTIILQGLGAAYSPGQELIKLPALQARLAEARAAIQAVDDFEAAKTVAIDERQAEFLDLDKYAVNIKRAADVEINDRAFTHDLQSIVNKFQSGVKSKPSGVKTKPPETGTMPVDGEDPPPASADPPKRAHSTSQRSFDDQIAHMAGILALLKTKSAYKPPDAEVRIAAVEARIDALEATNTAAKTAEAALGNAHDARDAVLYDPGTGLLALVKLVKTQLARKPGRESAAYQQITALEFRRG